MHDRLSCRNSPIIRSALDGETLYPHSGVSIWASIGACEQSRPSRCEAMTLLWCSVVRDLPWR